MDKENQTSCKNTDPGKSSVPPFINKTQTSKAILGFCTPLSIHKFNWLVAYLTYKLGDSPWDKRVCLW